MELFGRDRRMLAVVAGLLVGTLVIAAATGLLRGDDRARPPRARRATETGSSAPSTPPARVLSSRDPFAPPPALRSPPPAASPPTDDGTPGAMDPEPAETGSIGIPPATTSPPETPPDCGTKRPSECRVVGSHLIVLVRVRPRHPRPSVDLELDGDPVANVRRGDRFADGFKLVGFNDSLCARIVFGADAFTLCERLPRS